MAGGGGKVHITTQALLSKIVHTAFGGSWSKMSKNLSTRFMNDPLHICIEFQMRILNVIPGSNALPKLITETTSK